MFRFFITFMFLWKFSKSSCNEATCSSVVSKCLLLQSCQCTPSDDLFCFKNCFDCLEGYATECCGCLDICPNDHNDTDTLNKQSHIGDFADTTPGLFRVLTEFPDELDRWTTMSVPLHVDVNQYGPNNNQIKFYMAGDKPANNNSMTVNCTVIFMPDCISWHKCRRTCRSMGSSSYRWFHDGCCECLGEHCIHHGINESQCRDCPVKSTQDKEEDNPDEDYGSDYDYEED